MKQTLSFKWNWHCHWNEIDIVIKMKFIFIIEKNFLWEYKNEILICEVIIVIIMVHFLYHLTNVFKLLEVTLVLIRKSLSSYCWEIKFLLLGNQWTIGTWFLNNRNFKLFQTNTNVTSRSLNTSWSIFIEQLVNTFVKWYRKCTIRHSLFLGWILCLIFNCFS